MEFFLPRRRYSFRLFFGNPSSFSSAEGVGCTSHRALRLLALSPFFPCSSDSAAHPPNRLASLYCESSPPLSYHEGSSLNDEELLRVRPLSPFYPPFSSLCVEFLLMTWWRSAGLARGNYLDQSLLRSSPSPADSSAHI